MKRITNWVCDLRQPPRSSRSGSRRRRGLRPWLAEWLEDRVVLAPTPYSVTNAFGSAADTGSLPWAIAQANTNTTAGGSLIEFSPLAFSGPQVITLSSTLIFLETPGPEIIEGPGAGLLTISGGYTVRVVLVEQGVSATISGLTISDGFAGASASPLPAGGGLANVGGTVALSGVAVSYNKADGESGGVAGVGGGIAQFGGTLNLTDDTVCSNTATGAGIGPNFAKGSAGAPGQPAMGGGLYIATGLVTIVDSTFAGNTARGGTGGDGGNSALGVGGAGGTGGAGAGGGIYNAAGTITIVDSTFAGNAAFGGLGGPGGIGALRGSPGQAGAATGGGVQTQGGSVDLYNTIVAQNVSGTDDEGSIVDASASDISGWVAGEYNLVGAGGSPSLAVLSITNQVGVANPGLGELANNGGPTASIALEPGSPAIGAGSIALAVDPATGQALTTDQRGPGFVRSLDGSVDIGAYEVQPSGNGGGSGGSNGSQPAVVTAVSVEWGDQTAALYTASDGMRLLPAGRNTDLPWLGIDSLKITFNEPELLTASEVKTASQKGIDYGPLTITGSGENFTITFAHPINKADRVTISIAGAGLATYTRRLDVLPGDFNDTGAVTKQDATAIRNEWKHRNGAQPTIFGDILGIGTVNRSDYHTAQKLIGTKLPGLSGKTPKVMLARALARQRSGVKRHY